MMDCTWLTVRLCIVLTLVSFGVDVVQSDSTNDELRDYLKNFNKNRHHVTNPDGKTHARDFIRETFKSFGLHTWMESFVPSPPNTEVTQGQNVIGMLPGKSARTRADRLILIGSHYDTMRNTLHGADDNGSGMVALLQVAKLLTTKWDKCTREYSVMFVAFDFEEEEKRREPGCACSVLGCGSRAFVSNFSRFYNLRTDMSIARYGQLQGAIIMDTMMNYNSTPNSQHMDPHQELLKKNFPEQYNTIANNNFRGDFLIAVGRYSDDAQLLNTFSYYYKKDKPKYKLHVFRLRIDGQPSKLSDKDKLDMSTFFRSDHVSFWNETTSNRAIFLSDTANMRSYMTVCYHRDCDSLSHVTNDFLGFLSKSCDTIVMTTNYLTKAECKMISSTEESPELPVGGSMTIGMLLGAVASFFGVYCCWYCRKKKANDDELVVNDEQNWSSTNPVYAGQEPEGTGNRGTGNRGTGNTGTGITGTGITGTGITGTGITGTGITGTGITGTGNTGTGIRGTGVTGTGITGTGNRGTENTGTGITGTGITGTGNKGVCNEVRKPKGDAEPNIYEAVWPDSRWQENEASAERPSSRESGNGGASKTWGSGTRESGKESIA